MKVKLLACLAGMAVLVLSAETLDLKKFHPTFKNTPRAELDAQVKAGGTPSLRLTRETSVIHYFPLKADTDYRLTFLVKGKDIASGRHPEKKLPCGARISIYFGRSYTQVYSLSGGRPETGTFDWRKGQFDFRTPKLEKGKKCSLQFILIGSGTVWYDDVQITEVKKDYERDYSFREAFGDTVRKCFLIPDGCVGFFDPGQQVSFKLDVESPDRNLEYAFRVTDETGREVCKSPRKKLEKSFTVPGQECGYYIVHMELFSGAKKVYRLQSAFAVNVPLKKRDPFFQAGNGTVPRLYDALKRVGIGTIDVKLNIYKDWTPETSPVKHWEWLKNTFFKPYVDGGEFELVFTYSSRLKSRPPRTKQQIEEGYPVVNDVFLKWSQDFIRHVAEQNKGKVKYWSIQQELPSAVFNTSTDVGTWTEATANCLTMVRLVSRLVRKIDPAAKVVVGGNNIERTLEKERTVMQDLAKEYDIYMIDGYGGNWDMRLSVPFLPEDGLLSFYKAASDFSASLGKGKVFRNHETGYSIHYGAPFDRGIAVEQAQKTARIIIISRAMPVAALEIFRMTELLYSDRKDPDRSMNTVWKPFYRKGRGSFTVGTDYVPLPGGAMFATATSQLSFAKAEKMLVTGSAYSCIFVKADGSTLVTLWDIERERDFALELPADAVLTNMYGRSRKIAAGKQTLKVGPAPIYLTMNHPAGKAVEWMKKSLRDNMPEFLCGGYFTGTDRAAVFVRNLTGTMAKGVLSCSSGEKRDLSVPPGKTVRLNLALPVGGSCSFTAAGGRVYPIRPEKNDLVKIVRLASAPKLDGSGAWLKGLPSGMLQYPDHIFPKSALQPEKRYFRSERYNPDGHNVSVKYWIAYDDDHLYLAAEADDPVHIQRQDGMHMWRDDSLQFALSMADPVPASVRTPAEKADRSSFNYGLALGDKGMMQCKFLGKDAGPSHFPAQVTRKNGRTYYEVAIPFKALGGKPRRFGFVVFDKNDPALADPPYHLEFSGGITGAGDDSKLKYLLFE